MVWRETRGASRRFLFFLASIAVGVASIVGVGNIGANFDAMTSHETRNLLAADIEVRLKGPLSESGEVILAELVKEGVSFIHLSELAGMAMNPESGATRLVELKAVEADYPFYGRLAIEPELARPFKNPNSVLVQEGLLIHLGLSVGNEIAIGDATFIIRGVIKREPDRVAGPFSLGPRVLLSQEGLKQANLIHLGSRVRRKLLLKGTAHWTPEALKSHLETALEEETLGIKTYREVRPRLARFLENFTIYLGLVGLVTLLIGGIGVAGNIHAFLSERVETIAILKSLGGTSPNILFIYLLLALMLGGIGSILGIGLGVGIYTALAAMLSDFLPEGFSFQLTWLPTLQGMAMGLLTTFLFSLWPLRVVGDISPSRVFRHDVDMALDQFKRIGIIKPLLVGMIMVVGWIALAIWQAGSWRLGGTVVAAVAGSSAILLLFGIGLLRLIKKISSPKSLTLKYGIRNLHRPGRQVMTIFLSLGIGVMILLTLAQVEQRLMAELQQNIPEDAPGLFLIDIQPDQKEAVEQILENHSLKQPPTVTALVRSRLHSIDGQKVSEMEVSDPTDSFYLAREYVLTYQAALPDYNIIKTGTWWEADEKNNLLSVEKEVAEHLGLGVSSEVSFDIQGVQIEGRITSVREVDWGSMAINFYFIFSPLALSGAPETYVATVSVDPAEDLPIQNAVIGSFPNITVIPVREVLQTIAEILREISRTIQFMALMAFIVGLIVVAGAIAATRARRVHEMVLFKTLGATRPDLMAMMAVEYLLLGLVAALIGGGLSIALSWIIIHFFLKISWVFVWQTVLMGGTATVVLTLVTGFLTSYRILGEKPFVVLRAE